MYLSLLTIPLTYSVVSIILFYVISLFLGEYIEMTWNKTFLIVGIVFACYYIALLIAKRKGYSLDEIYGENCQTKKNITVS